MVSPKTIRHRRSRTHLLPIGLALCLLPVPAAAQGVDTREATSAVRIEVRPRSALVDERVEIRVFGLAPEEEVALRAEMTDQAGVPWASEVVLRADRGGSLDLAEAVPLSGSYQGADAMGHIWSMVPATVLRGSEDQRREFLRETRINQFAIEDVAQPTIVTLRLEREGESPLTTSYERLNLAPDVRAESLHHGRLRGLFFSPEGEERRPGLIVLAGSGGGVNSGTAALLASRGYAALALAYFRYEDLPTRMHRIPLEYFAEGIAWLRAELGHDGIGVWGRSRGGELALLLGATFPDDIEAVVANVPSSHRFPGHAPEAGGNVPAWIHQGEVLPFASLPVGWLERLREIRQWRVLFFGAPVEMTPFFLRAIANSEVAEPAAIEVEKIRCPLLTIGGGADTLWPSGLFVKLVGERLQQKGSQIAYHPFVYEEAGHRIAGSYRPLGMGGVIYHRENERFMNLGGSPRADAEAGADSWAEALRFLTDVDWFADPGE
jgi:dienelactone hydrolase